MPNRRRSSPPRFTEARRWSLPAACVAALVCSAPAAHAQDAAGNASAAQALFESAVEEMAARNYASACPKLEESTRLVPDAVGAKAQLAECYEGWGRSASAWSQWTLVEALASRQGQTERTDLAASRIAALRPRLATLTIRLDRATTGLPGLGIKRDDVAIGRAQWGSAIPVDVGPHAIEVSAPGRVTWRTTTQVPADGATVAVAVPGLAEAASASPPDAGAGQAARPPSDSEGATPWHEPVGIVAMGVGGAGLVVGSIFGALALGKNGDADAGPCDAETNICSDEGIGLRDDAVGLATVSTVAFTAGAVLAVAGGVVFLTAPDEPSSEAGVRTVRVTAGGISAEGRF